MFPYVNTDVGVSYMILAQYKIGTKLYANAGLRYLQNTSEEPKYNNERLHHRFRANSFTAHVGLSVGLVYHIKWRYEKIQPYLYYDLCFFNADTKSNFLPDDTSTNTDRYVPVLKIRYTNLYSFENGIGIGATAAIASNLRLNTRVGISANIISNLPVAYYPSGMHINAAIQYAIGLQYNFNRRRNR